MPGGGRVPNKLRRFATLPETLTSLRERPFAWYFTGSFSFFMAMAMMLLVINFLAFDLTDAAWSLAVVGGTGGLVLLLAAPVGGVYADRLNKRTLLVTTEALAAAFSFLVTLLIITDLVTFWHLATVMPVLAGLFSFIMPTRQAMVPSLVPQHKLGNAISLEMGGSTLTQIIAPAMAGVLIAPIGAGGVFGITSVLFGLAAITDTRLPRHGLVGNQTSGALRKDIVGGFRYIRHHRIILLLLVSSLTGPLFGFPVEAMMPVFAEDVFDKGSVGLGLLAAMLGVGGLVGALISARMDRQPRKGLLLMIGSGAMCVFMFGYSLAPSFLLALALLAGMSTGQMLYSATTATVTLSLLDEGVRGRVMSIQTMSFGVMPLGLVPVALATDAIGPRLALAISASILGVALVLFFALASEVRGLRLARAQEVGLSAVEAARLVAEGKLTEEEAKRRSGGRPAVVSD